MKRLHWSQRVRACTREGELPPTGAVADVSADVSFVASTNRIRCRLRSKTFFSRLLGKLQKPMTAVFRSYSLRKWLCCSRLFLGVTAIIEFRDPWILMMTGMKFKMSTVIKRFYDQNQNLDRNLEYLFWSELVDLDGTAVFVLLQLFTVVRMRITSTYAW
jgi:hypothetical protein